MLTGWAPLAVAAALLCWPHRRARSRARRLQGPHAAAGRPLVAHAAGGWRGGASGAGSACAAGSCCDAATPCAACSAEDVAGSGAWMARMLGRRRGPAMTAGAAAVLGLVAAGPAGAAAAAVAAGTGVARWRARRRTAAELAATTDLAAALGLLAAELRAGAHPAAAAERVASDTTAHAAGVFRTVAVTSRLCGDVSAALRRHARSAPALERPLGRLAAAWTLAQDHGIPLADVLDTVRGDLAHRVGADRRLHAALAGPRATAAVLAGLPVLGLLLGQAVGAAPWRVLTGGVAGQLLLLTGTVLICAGLTWSAWLVDRAAAT